MAGTTTGAPCTPIWVLDSSIDAMQTFNVRPDDIWGVTHPKSGTEFTYTKYGHDGYHFLIINGP